MHTESMPDWRQPAPVHDFTGFKEGMYKTLLARYEIQNNAMNVCKLLLICVVRQLQAQHASKIAGWPW